jgi:hypothetical protein
MAKKTSGPMPESLAEMGEWLEQKIQARSFPTWLDSSALPSVLWVDGSPAPAPAIVVLLRSKKEQERSIYESLRGRLEPTSMARLCDWLAARWVDQEAPTSERWALESLSDWGTDSSLTQVGQWVRVWIKKKKRGPAQAGLRLLARRATDAALHELDDIAHGPYTPAYTELARGEFEFAARQRGLSPDDMADRIVPTLDLDRTGSRWFVVGSKKVRAVLRSGPALEWRDEADQPLRQPPKPPDADPFTLTPADWFKRTKARLSGLVAHQFARLERAMIAGRTWDGSVWTSLFLAHPILRTMSQVFVWSVRHASREILFRVAEDFSLADDQEEVFTVESPGTIALPHPITFSEPTLARWRQIFVDYGLRSPWPQLDRETRKLSPMELAEPSIMRFVGVPVDSRLLRGHLKRKGWLMGPALRGTVEFHYRPFVEANLTAVLCHDPIWMGENPSVGTMIPLANLLFIPGEIDRTMGLGAEALSTVVPSQVSPILISETLRDVERLGLAAR